MRQKLVHAESVLEGIALENFDSIRNHARSLRQLGDSADWPMRSAPEYERMKLDFQRQCESLERAAQRKSVDAATVAYFQLTVSCVNCHRVIRGAQGASWAPSEPRLPSTPGNASPAVL